MSQHRTLRPSQYGGTFLSTFFKKLPRTPNSNLFSEEYEPIRGFHEMLSSKLDDLKPTEDESILCVDWLHKVLCLALQKHKEAEGLIPTFQVPLSDVDEKWMSEYLDETTKILDICNSLSASISDIEHGQLLIRHALHTLDCRGRSLEEADLMRAKKSLHDWVETIQNLKRASPGRLKKAESCSFLLQSMNDGLKVPREKVAAKGKGFLYALYGAKATTIFACSALALALSRKGEMSAGKLQLSDRFLWSTSIINLLQLSREEADSRIARGSNWCLCELENVNTSVRKLLGVLDSILSERNFPLSTEYASQLASALEEVKKHLDELMKGLDLVGKKLNEFFHSIVASRSALLDHLGGSVTRNIF